MREETEATEVIRLSRGFISDRTADGADEGRIELHDAYILITDNSITSIEEIQEILQPVIKSHARLLIIAGDVSRAVLEFIRYNKDKGVLEAVCVKLPADESGRGTILDNIARVFGGQVISDKYGIKLSEAASSMLGFVRYAEIGRDYTVMSNSMTKAKTALAALEETQTWNNWSKIPAGHKQAITALSALCNHTDEFLDELTGIQAKLEKTKSESQQIYDSAATRTKEQLEDKKRLFLQEYEKDIAALNTRKETVQTVVNACKNFSKNVSGAYGTLDTVKTQSKKVIQAIDNKAAAYAELYKFRVAAAEKACNDELNKAAAERIDIYNRAEQQYETERKDICDRRQKDISIGFSKKSIHNYQSNIEASRFNADNYECPITVPEYIMLGSIGLTIPNTSPDNMAVVHAVELQAEKVGTRQADEYVVKIPYSQRLSDGISLLMRYSRPDRSYVQGLIQPLLLKLFMSFPAGKLEATMIDPLELGASFPDISDLGANPDSARIIDTKIWSKDRDIENAIARLRQRLENMTLSYGDDQAARLRKEPVIALAVTDFPTNFTETALKDLHAIVRNSASLGVCVLICANDEELEKLKRRNGTLAAEITQCLIETRAFQDRLMLVGAGMERLFLQLDDMKDVLEQKDRIISILANVIEIADPRGESFYDMFKYDIYDSNNWFTGNHEEIAIPIGIKGADTVVKMVMGRGGGDTAHHALIAGLTGSGKSTFFHTLIMSTLISYSPDEVQMYLLDFKEGVEFEKYTEYRLPSLRVVAINSEREFGLNVLKELCRELETRARYFTRYDVSDISAYVKLSDVPNIPKLLLIFDEVQELFRSEGAGDSISAECLSCINKLVMQGRAMGIHIILACQDFRNCAGLEAYFSQMAIRIAIRGSVNGAASILNADNAGINTLQNRPAGAAIYNGSGGAEFANNFFQISYISQDERLHLLKCLDAYFTDPGIAPLFEDKQTRILLTNAEDDIHNCFNRLILEGAGSIEPLGKSADGYGLLLGQGLGKNWFLIPELRVKERDNLLVVSKDEKVALSLFELSAMSVLYEELHTSADKANTLVYIVDLFADELTGGECSFDFLGAQFSQQIEICKIGDIEGLIASLYETVIDRKERRKPSTERIFLLFFGINRARARLRAGGIYEEIPEGQLSTLEMLRKIVSYGPKYGINSIVWGESIQGIELMLGDRYESMFDKRIAYGLDKEFMDILVAESEADTLRGKTAVYMDVGNDIRNTHFRPYDIPAEIWIEHYAETYNKIVHEGDF